MSTRRPCQFLCISDVNLALLIENKVGGLVNLLLEALFLDPDSLRPDVSGSNKAAIQESVAESILQISLFPPGRELLKTDRGILEAVRALTSGKAWSQPAKISANGALLALEGKHREVEPEGEGENESPMHVMMS